MYDFAAHGAVSTRDDLKVVVYWYFNTILEQSDS